jgi:hypothetical protein
LAKYKSWDDKQRMKLPISLQDQILLGTLEYTISEWVEQRRSTLVSCQEISRRLSLSANYWLALSGILDVQFMHIRQWDSGSDLAVCHKFQIAR